MIIKINFGKEVLYINRHSYLSEISQEVGGSQQISLTKEIIDDFISRFGSQEELFSLIHDVKMLTNESPSLIELLKGKLGGSPYKTVEFRGGRFTDYENSIRTEPILTKLSNLCERRGIEKDRLYLWNVLGQMYKTSFVRLQELRLLTPTLNNSGSSRDTKRETILGSNLAKRLFWLKSSENRNYREKYNRIYTTFKELTSLEFDISVRVKEVDIASEEQLGVIRSEALYPGEFTPIVLGKRTNRGLMNEAFILVIKDNYPVAIEKTASGVYEILFLLTTIIGEDEKILLLDEPELHLHPTMQKRVLNLVTESITKGRNQIVLITHSPYLLSSSNLDTTWRFTSNNYGTRVHNLGEVLLELGSQEKSKLTVKLSSPIIRSLLFSRGVIFVEGPSDKIVIEYVDRYLSSKKKGANIDENEWSVIDIGGKNSLLSFMTLSRMLGVPNLTVMDYDALMRRDKIIQLPEGQKTKTSIVFSALWHTDKTENLLDTLSGLSGNEYYDNLEKIRSIAFNFDIFVFSKDLEGEMQSFKTNKKSKPLKALERIIDLINQESIPPEFIRMCEFFKKKIYDIPDNPKAA